MAEARSARWRVGAARIDITPDDLSNLDPRGGAFTAVHDPLELRCIVIDDGEALCAIVSLDVIEVGDTRDLARRVEEETGVPAARVLVVATHTHSAPRVGRVSPGALALAARPEYDAYTRLVSDRLIDAVRAASARLRPAHLAYGRGTVDVNVNRDLFADGAWRSARNDDGPSDKALHVLRLVGEDDRSIAVLVNYAVHSTVTFGTGAVSADLAGASTRHLERLLGDDAVGLWLPGALGDQDPRIRLAEHAAPDDHEFAHRAVDAMGLLVGAEAARATAAARELADPGPVVVLSAVHPLPTQPSSDPRDDSSHGISDSVDLPLTVVLLGDVALCGAGGEVVTEVADLIRARSPLRRTIVVSLLGDRIGYLTTDEAYTRPTFESLRSPVRQGHAQHALVEGFAELAAAALAARRPSDRKDDPRAH